MATRWKTGIRDSETLLEVLRDRLGLTGTKRGCDQGACGACTVLLDGRPVLSCLTLAASVEGREVTTVEGLAAPDGTLHPVQRAFHETGAVQCGFCTPGMLLVSKALLDAQSAPLRRRDTAGAVGEYLSLHRVREDRGGGRQGCRDAGRSMRPGGQGRRGDGR